MNKINNKVAIVVDSKTGWGHLFEGLRIGKELYDNDVPFIFLAHPGKSRKLFEKYRDFWGLEADFIPFDYIYDPLKKYNPAELRQCFNKFDPFLKSSYLKEFICYNNQKVIQTILNTSVAITDILPIVSYLRRGTTNPTVSIARTDFWKLRYPELNHQIRKWIWRQIVKHLLSRDSIIQNCILFNPDYLNNLRSRARIYDATIFPFPAKSRKKMESKEKIRDVIEDLFGFKEFLLLTFGGVGMKRQAVQLSQKIDLIAKDIEYPILVVGEGNERFRNKGEYGSFKHMNYLGRPINLHDYISTAEGVISKRGYGTLTECVTNGTPLMMYCEGAPEGKLNMETYKLFLNLPHGFYKSNFVISRVSDLFELKEKINNMLRQKDLFLRATKCRNNQIGDFKEKEVNFIKSLWDDNEEYSDTIEEFQALYEDKLAVSGE
ncbi:MAG: hypothetical protein ACFE95_09310 [Candidatus Hodarchaeota archaeon]